MGMSGFSTAATEGVITAVCSWHWNQPLSPPGGFTVTWWTISCTFRRACFAQNQLEQELISVAISPTLIAKGARRKSMPPRNSDFPFKEISTFPVRPQGRPPSPTPYRRSFKRSGSIRAVASPLLETCPRVIAIVTYSAKQGRKVQQGNSGRFNFHRQIERKTCTLPSTLKLPLLILPSAKSCLSFPAR